jgi:CDP-glucose 4,6-dehydratase
VLEPLSGYLALAERLHGSGSAFAEGWNFGPNDMDAQPVQWIVENMLRLWGKGSFRVEMPESALHEAKMLKLDVSKAKARLGWTPRWPLLRTLETIVKWHHAFVNSANMREVSLGQIAEFEYTPARR